MLLSFSERTCFWYSAVMETTIGAKRRSIELALVVSIVAVLLSQFKPLYTYLEKPEIDAFIGRNAAIYENWGHVQANFYIQLVNKGNAAGIVRKVEFFLNHKSSGLQKLLKGQSYYLQPGAIGSNETVSQIPFSNISIEPKGVWSSFVNSFPDYPKSQEKKVAELTLRVEQDLNLKIIPSGRPVTINEGLFDEIVSFTRSNANGFVQGEYTLLALVWIDQEKSPSLKKGFSFSIYESDIAKLRAKEREMRFGGGIIYPIPNVKQHTVSFNAKMIEIKDQVRIGKLFKTYQANFEQLMP